MNNESLMSWLFSGFNFRTVLKCKVGRATLKSSAGFNIYLITW